MASIKFTMGKFTAESVPTETRKKTAKSFKREKVRAQKVYDVEEKNEKNSDLVQVVNREESKKRDLAGDLRSYVSMWRGDKASWKFNKRLQVYLLKSCFDSEKVDKQLFHDVLPYLASISGGARAALLKDCDQLMEGGDSVEPSTEVRRAKKIKAAFGSKE